MRSLQSTFGYFCVLLVLCVAFCPISAAEPTYWQDIRPVFRKHCIVCHSEKNLKDDDLSGRLALDSYEAALKGGKIRVVKPGDSAGSMLAGILRHSKKDRRMPKDAEPLPDETVALIKAWIDAGAKEGVRPAETTTATVAASRLGNLDVAFPTRLQKPPKFELVLKIGPLSPIAAVAYSPDGTLLATGSYGRVTVWDTKDAEPIQTITQVLGAVNDLKFSPDGTILAVAGGQPSARGDLRLFSTKDWKLLANLGGHLDVVACVAFTPDGKTLASASFDKTVRIWDIASHEVKQTLTGHSDFVYAVAFSPKGDWLVTASKDRTVRLSETATGKSRLTFSGMEQDVMAVAVTPDGSQVVSSGYEAGLFWWNAQTGERTKRQSGHDVAVHELAFDKAGKMVASAGGDKTVRLWNGANGEPIRTLPIGSMVYAVALRPDGQQVVAGCFDGTVRVWETANARPLVTVMSAGNGDVNEWLAITPEGYVACSDGLVGRGRWQSAGQAWLGDPIWPILRQSIQVAKSWRGDKIAEPSLPSPKR